MRLRSVGMAAILLAASCMIPLRPVAAQENTPVPPSPPEARPPAEAPETPETHIRRHKMTRRGSVSIELETSGIASADSLARRIEKTESEIERLEAEGEREQAELERKRLELLREQAELLELERELDQLEPTDRTTVVIPGPDLPAVVLRPDGRARVLMPRDGDGPTRRIRGDKISFFEPLYIDESDFIDASAVAIFESVHVKGHVDEDVISIGGNVYVDGTVGGNVVAPFGEVFLGENAVIEGDVVAVDLYDKGGFIGGQIEEVSLPRMPWTTGGVRSFYALLATTVISVTLLAVLLGLLLRSAATRHVQIVEERMRTRPVASFFGGVLIEILAFPVWLLLVVTVIGIPVALLAMPLVLLAAKLLGFTALSIILGRAVMQIRDGERPGWAVFLVGAVLLHAPLLAGIGILASANGSLGGTIGFVATMLTFLGLCTLYIASTAGLGAAIFSRLGTRALPVAERPARGGPAHGPIGPQPLPHPPGPTARAT